MSWSGKPREHCGRSVFDVFAFPVQIAGCPESEADMNIKVFWISSPVYNGSLCLRLKHFFQVFHVCLTVIFCSKFFWCCSSFVLLFPLSSYKPASTSLCKWVSECEVWWQNYQMSPSKAVWAQKGSAVLLRTMAEGRPAERGLCREGRRRRSPWPSRGGKGGLALGRWRSQSWDSLCRCVPCGQGAASRVSAGVLAEEQLHMCCLLRIKLWRGLPCFRENGRAPSFLPGYLNVY